MEAKCDDCGCECGGQTNVCPHTGAAQVKRQGTFSTVSGMGIKYSSRWVKNGVPAKFDSSSGVNWMSGSMPMLSQCASGEIATTFDLCTAYWFSPSGGGYAPRFGAKQELLFDSALCRFIFKDCNGSLSKFTNRGVFDYSKSADGREIAVTERTPDGKIQKIARTVTQDGKNTTDANIFEYYESGAAEGLVKQITFQRSTNPTAGIRRMVYTYYGTNEEHGSTGDLKTATEQLLIGTTWVNHETSYYRYYKAGELNGFEHGLKFALDPEAFERLKGDPQVSDPFLATDDQVAKYADSYFEYNADQRVTKSVVNAGLLTYLFAYETSAHSDDYNHWKLKVTQTNPDGSQRITYNNFIGQAMLTDLASGSDHWLEFHQFDSQAHEVLRAMPSAVVSYDDAAADLNVVLEVSSGLIHLTDFYSTTTATSTTPGGAAGYVQFKKVQQGITGATIKLSEIKYFKRVTPDVTIYPVAESTVFRFDDGTGAITTSFAYLWFTDTVQVEQKTTTLPIVPTSQNGTGTTDSVTEIFDNEGNVVWQRDPRGFITHRAYDLPTGSVVQQISDVDGAKLTLPSGWTTPAFGGLHLITDYKNDALGRITETLGPVHVVNGQSIRQVTWTVYRDLENEVLTGQGFAQGTGPDYSYVLVNPVSIRRTSEDGRTQESIVAVRDCAAGKPCECLAPDSGTVESSGPLSASDCFPQSSWVRWSQTLSSDQSQVTSSRTYHLIPAHGIGTIGINYDQTLYNYDVMGRQNRIVSPTFTIQRTVFDVRGLAISNWVGTNDNGATDSDPAGSGAGGNNMVQIIANEYDSGSAGGDGNLTQTTHDVVSVTTRVTAYQYDFRNRRTVTNGEIDFYEVLIYDNLDHVVQIDRRNTSGGGNLIARSETKFDNRGRVYQTVRYSVNPATGAVGNSLVDNTFYDASGNVIENAPSGNETFTKTTFDGVRRQTARYVGYVVSLSSSSSSSSSSGGSVATGDVIFEQSETVYDAASNAIFVTSRQRFHDATGTGPLQGPSGSQPKSRDSYLAIWYDGVGRQVAMANYGTNDNAGPPTRPDEPPASSDTVLVSQTHYNERGEAFESVDPAGMVSRTYADDAGRPIRTIQNFVSSSALASGESASEE